MNKRDLVKEVARKTDFKIWEVDEILAIAFQTMAEHIQENMPVSITGFGRFKLKYISPRVVYNPREKIKMDRPAKSGVTFIPSSKIVVTEEVMAELGEEFIRKNRKKAEKKAEKVVD